MKNITINFGVPDDFDDPSEVKLRVRDLLLTSLVQAFCTPRVLRPDERELAKALLAEE